MAQQSSLPNLTAFLRTGPTSQSAAENATTALSPLHGADTGNSVPPQRPGRARAAEKRRLPVPDASTSMNKHAAFRQQALLPPPGGGALLQHVYDPESSLQQQPKRRANLFVQYGETQQQQQQLQVQQLQVQQQHQQNLVPPSFDGRRQQQQQQPPPLSHAHPDPRHRAYPTPVQHRDHQSFPAFAGNYDRNTGTSNAPLVEDAHRVLAVTTESPAGSSSAAIASGPQEEPVATAHQHHQHQRERTSRYLSEEDRRAIIRRIDSGEKQVALAKEFLVSRAAICNLYKNRQEVLTRAERNPSAKHPKRQKTKATTTTTARGTSSVKTEPPKVPLDEKEEEGASDGMPGGDELMSEELSSAESDDVKETTSFSSHTFTHTAPTRQHVRIYDASAGSYPIRGLVSILRNPQLPLATYRQVTRRLVRCLMEEVVACLPQPTATIVAGAGGGQHAIILPHYDDSICAVSIEEQGTHTGMLHAFTEIFPSSSTGMLSLSATGDPSTSNPWQVHSGCLPVVHSNQLVLLLVTSCATGNRVCTALEHLVAQRRIDPANIYIATLISSKPGLARVHTQFPGVTIVSGAIDDAVDDLGLIRPGIGEITQRSHFALGASR